jgi:DinB superfamily
MSLVRPESSEYAPFYAGYVARVPEDDILSVLQRQGEEIRDLARSLPAAKETYRYADRVFGYRAFCFSRGEQAPLPSFDENQYVAAAGADKIPASELSSEFAAVRASNLAFLRRLSAAEAMHLGTASGKPISVRALAYVMAGHPRHHVAVLRERYGVA